MMNFYLIVFLILLEESSRLTRGRLTGGSEGVDYPSDSLSYEIAMQLSPFDIHNGKFIDLRQ